MNNNQDAHLPQYIFDDEDTASKIVVFNPHCFDVRMFKNYLMRIFNIGPEKEDKVLEIIAQSVIDKHEKLLALSRDNK